VRVARAYISEFGQKAEVMSFFLPLGTIAMYYWMSNKVSLPLPDENCLDGGPHNIEKTIVDNKSSDICGGFQHVSH
jgi:nitrate reductase alpha subunit